ncbi:MAG: TRAP transporter small permease [Rhizobiales bacterium]|nr:TRAP transporter small permease [Hyphomicrobiales bacterium]
MPFLLRCGVWTVIDRIATIINRTAGGIAALLLVYILCHILYEIVLRVGFSSSTYVLDEFVGYAVAAMTFLSLGYALDTGGMIRVDIALGRMRGKPRRVMELICVTATFLMTCFCAWYMWSDVKRNWVRGSVSESVAEVPLWIPTGAVWLGLTLFALQLLFYFIRIVRGGPMISSGASE